MYKKRNFFTLLYVVQQGTLDQVWILTLPGVASAVYSPEQKGLQRNLTLQTRIFEMTF